MHELVKADCALILRVDFTNHPVAFLISARLTSGLKRLLEEPCAEVAETFPVKLHESLADVLNLLPVAILFWCARVLLVQM